MATFILASSIVETELDNQGKQDIVIAVGSSEGTERQCQRREVYIFFILYLFQSSWLICCRVHVSQQLLTITLKKNLVLITKILEISIWFSFGRFPHIAA